MNPAIGECDCPLCAAVGKRTTAEVARHAKGKKSLYLRCPECGTIQPLFPAGQAAMRRIARIFDAGPPQDAAVQVAAEEAAHTAATTTTTAIRQERRRSLASSLSAFFAED
jgi:uncharacterized Zn finger protein